MFAHLHAEDVEGLVMDMGRLCNRRDAPVDSSAQLGLEDVEHMLSHELVATAWNNFSLEYVLFCA